MNSRRLLVRIFAVLLVLGSSSSYAEVAKVDSHLSLLSHKSANVAVAQKHSILKSVNGGPDLLVSAIVRFQGNLDGVEALGCIVRSVIGDVATLDMPLSAVERVVQLPNIIHIEASKSLKHRLNASVPATGANTLRSGTPPNWSGKTGKGVVIGIIDTGIDLNHKDFKNAAGKTRILSLWDQTVNGTHPAGYAKGNECTQAAIDASNCSQKDTNGHGTLVAGIAAGNGSATGNGQSAYRYIGMAPEADLIVVKLGSIDTASVLDAIAYIQSKAAALGKPSVINLSFGSHYGPHDGTSSYERGLDNLSGAGKVIVAAAGNEAQDNIHASGYVYQGSNTTVGFSVPAGYGANLDIWYPGASQFGVSVSKGSCTTPIVNPGNTQTFQTACGRIDISSSAVNPNNGDREIVISLSNGNAPVSSGAWNFTLTGISVPNGRFDVWSNDEVATFTSYTDSSITLNDSATATKTIAVAAYTTKNTWQSIDGYAYHYSTYPQIDAIASFSSYGPRRSCSDAGKCPLVQKPEITAPGMGIMSAKSAQISGLDQAWVDPDGVHLLAAGTSMAAPHVTGAVALILQLYPTLTSDQVKGMLTSSAKNDWTMMGGVPNFTWGYGKLDVAAAIAAIPPVPVMNLATSDIIYDKFRGKIYASVPGRSSQYPNSIVVINPETVSIESAVSIGNEPNKLAISDDGQFLYVGLIGSVRRIALATLTPDLEFSLGSYTASEIEVLPGHPNSVAIALKPSCCNGFEGVAIYDEGVKRPVQTAASVISNVIEFSSTADRLYGYNNISSEFGFRRMVLDQSGVSVADAIPAIPTTDISQHLVYGWVDFQYWGGLLYATNGKVVNPESLTTVGTFTGVPGDLMSIDPATGRVFFIDNMSYRLGQKAKVYAYDMYSFQLLGTQELNIPDFRVFGPARLIRWAGGLAFRNQLNDMLFLIKSPLIPEIDTTPNPFTFVSQSNVAVNTVTVSNSVTINGITTPAPISITGGEYSINGGTWTSAAGTITNGQTVRVRLTSSGSYSTTTSATLTIGGVSGVFSVTTMAAPDTTPDNFSFTSRILVPTSLMVVSDPVTVSGINTDSSVSVVGGEYSINGGAWTSAAGTVTNGQVVRVRQTSSGGFNVTTTVTLTIGGVSAGFSVTTVSSHENTLHATWYRTDAGYTSWISIKNTSGSAVNLVPTLIGYDGSVYVEPVQVSLAPHQAAQISLNGYGSKINGQTSAAVELAYAGITGSIVADVITVGPQGFSYTKPMASIATATSTTLNATWYRADSDANSWVVVKNTSGGTVQANITVSNNGISYTDPTPIVVGPHRAQYVGLSQYNTKINAMTGGIELTHTGIPGDVIADVIGVASEGASYTIEMVDRTTNATTLQATWYRADPGYGSWVLVKNNSNNTIYADITVSNNGISYTEKNAAVLPPREAQYVYLNKYNGNVKAMSAAVELSHSGNPGDVVADLIVMGGQEGYCFIKPMVDGLSATTTLAASWFRVDPGYGSWVLVKNTSDQTTQTTITIVTYTGSTYTDPTPVVLPPHQAEYVYLNKYNGYLNGQTAGTVTLMSTGIPGDVMADMISVGPEGYVYTNKLR